MMAEATVVALLSYEEESTMAVRSTAPTNGWLQVHQPYFETARSENEKSGHGI
jgi:hypothetical protein